VACPTLAGVLRDAGLIAHAVDLDGLGTNENFLLSGLEDYDAIGISALTAQAEGARRIIALIRHAAPEKYIVCGGADPSLFPEKYLSWGASAVVVGEAEGNIVGVFSDRPTGIVQGVAGSLDTVPAWDVTQPAPWRYPGHPKPLALPEAVMMTSRGCPRDCVFCGNPYRGRRPRLRSIESVKAEMDYLSGNGVRAIFLYDDALVDRPLVDHAVAVMATGSGRFVFRAQGHCSFTRTADAEALAVMHSLGLRRVMWGVESLSDAVLRAVGKGTSVDAVMATLEAARAARLENFVFLVAGLPGETTAEARLTQTRLEILLRDGLVQHVQVTACTPMYGTTLYRQAEAEGWLWQGDPYQAAVQGAGPWMSQGDLAEHVHKLKGLAAAYGAL
jgi:radical SAM superfamily enzyme YgiQ (UPF0313 family)